MKNLFRRIGAIVLALCLLVTTMPTAVRSEGLNSADGVTDLSGKVLHNGNSTYYYDGNPVTITASCEGITEWSISYSDSTGGTLGYAPSAVGSYTVHMSGKGTDCYANATFSFRIAEGQIAYSVSNYSGVYDGNPHSISLSVSTPDVAVYYATDGEYSPSNPHVH